PVIAFVALAASGNDYRVPAFVAAAFSGISILLTWFWLDETHPAEKRRGPASKTAFSLASMRAALLHPAVGLLLGLIFVQQIAFGGFEQLLSLFTLSRLGLNASGNAVIFVFVGIIVVAVQGGMIGPWSRRLGDRRLIYLGLALMAVGLALTALTPRQPVPWYSRDKLQAELSASGDFRTHEVPTTRSLSIELPSDERTGWLGLGWILLAMVPAAIGGGILHPSINSLITKRVENSEVGGMLGISAAFLSAANAFAPLAGGAIFQVFGSTAPFLFGGLLMAVLLLVTLQYLKPGREDAHPGDAIHPAGGH
ncbi:MAG: MFS transporter, partial [Chloroflexota bacterium]